MRVRLSRVVLIGLPGAGKTTVGPILARRLGFDFVDVDRGIEDDTGMDVPTIFRERGESFFRDLERDAMVRLLESERVVLAPGGGWAAQRGAMADLPAGTVTVWLKVSAGEAARRLEHDDAERPLLRRRAPDGSTPDEDIAARIGRLEGERLLSYSAANIVVEADDSGPEAIVDRIAARLQSEYGIDGQAD